jgi:hypothetical protein
MSLEKYESLLREQSLFFCRADKFSDPYECSIPKKEFDYRISEKKFLYDERVNYKTDRNFDLEIAKRNANNLAYTHKEFKRATTVNCWHINNNESDAMWQLYLKNNEGVAVRTNKKKLYKSLEIIKENICVSKIRYINYENDIWFHSKNFPFEGYNFLTPVFHKRIEFEHEKELRLYHHVNSREKEDYWETQPNTMGEMIKIDLKNLVENIIFHPSADSSTKEKIIRLTKKYTQDFTFYSSKLSNEPYY